LRHWVVNVRASYFDETREQIDGMWGTLGYKKIGVIIPKMPLRGGARRCEGALKTHGAEPIAVASYQRRRPRWRRDRYRESSASGSVVLVAFQHSCANPQAVHAKGWKPLFLTVSFVGTDELIQEAGPDAEGTVITQVVRLLPDGFQDVASTAVR